jgi:CMP-N,N'-diacetyllegionaminic acid synthase
VSGHPNGAAPGFRVLGLVPARAGSKGVPGKHLRLLGARPLLQYTAEAALASRQLSRVVLSTDDERIAALGRRCGLDVPFRRPPDLAQDDTPMLPVVRHALQSLEATGNRYDAVCLLQPTSPLRTPEDIDGCIELLLTSGADAVVTTLPVPPEHNPHWVYLTDDTGALRLSTGARTPIPCRQQLPAAVHREGSVYVTRTRVVVEQGSLYGERLVGYPIAPERSVNIDDPEDWAKAEQMLLHLGAI